MRVSVLIAVVVAALAIAFSTWRGRTGEAAAQPSGPQGLAATSQPAVPAELRAPRSDDDHEARSVESPGLEPEALAKLGSGANLEDAAGPAVRVLGLVQRADRTPFSRVAVVASSLDGARPKVMTRTDRGGEYALALVPGRWRLTAVTHGFARTRAELHVAEGADELDGPTFVLLEGLSIRGRVLDEHDQPVAGISVACADEENGALQFFVGDDEVEYGLHLVNSDELGRFEFVGLEDATHSLYARLHLRPELVAAPRRLTGVRAGEDDVVILRVRADLRFVGRVVNAATGEPLDSIRFNGVPVETNEGRFELPVHGEAALAIDAPGFRVWRSPVTAAELGPGEQLIALEPDLDTARLELRVVDGDEHELSNVTARGWSVAGGSFEASGDGVLVIEKVTAATYRLKVAALGHLSQEHAIELRPGAEEHRTVVLEPGFPLRVHLYDILGRTMEHARMRVERPDGTPVGCEWIYDHAPRGATLWISSLPLPTEPEAWAEIRHEVDGRIEGLPVGDYQLRLIPPTGKPIVIGFVISAEGERELSLRL